LFLFVPRLPGQFWVLPSRGAATSGLSEEMSPGDVSDLSLSSDVAFRVEFEGEPPPASQRYWRAVVLHDFDGRTWRRRRGEMFAPQKVIAGEATYRYRMLMEPSNLQWIRRWMCRCKPICGAASSPVTCSCFHSCRSANCCP
jgi:hypothetical protein